MQFTTLADKTLSEQLACLYQRRTAGIKPGLATERALLKRLNNPENGLKIVHVAGTNGKGTVCAIIEAVLRHSGLRTGLYTSPHLINFNERIKVNGKCIPDVDLAALIKDIETEAKILTKDSEGREVTFFEFATALAFEYFKRQEIDIAIIETGMGGRLDATNIITPLLSVITGISMEHTQWLGDDIQSITREKCGIIKPGIPLIVGQLPEEALRIVTAIANKLNCPVIHAEKVVSIQRKSQDLTGQQVVIETSCERYGTLKLALPGKKVIQNTAIALAALEELKTVISLDISSSIVKKGMESLIWPGRCQILSEHPPVILDGAHNPEGAQALANTLKELFNDIPMGLILGISADKDLAGFLKPFTGIVKHCWAVAFNNERSLSPCQIIRQASEKKWMVSEATLPDALEQACIWAKAQHGAVCITGSLFLVGEVLQLYRLTSISLH